MPHTVKNVLVIGCNGGFGEQFCRRFASDGMRVNGIDLHPAALTAESVTDYSACDIVHPNGTARALLATADWIISAVPEAPAVAALPGIATIAKRGALLADILSVKGRIVEVATAGVKAQEYLSLHPLFAPQEEFRGTVAVIPVHRGAESPQLLQCLETWGGTMLVMTADDHDRSMAMVQVIAHAAILAFGAAGEKLLTTCSPLATTPVHTMLCALVRRVTGGDPALYWDIQRNNTYASEARELLVSNLRELAEIVGAADFERFTAMFQQAQRSIAHPPARTA
jgi:prephenate dehydrogenase